jgi:hypothetical protein
MSTSIQALSTTTRAASKAAFVHVTDVIHEDSNITAAFKKGGIEDIPSILKLTDVTADHLTFLDPDHDPTITVRLRKGETGLIKTFIHFVHYREEISDPIGDKWLSITQEESDQFHVNLKYTRRFASLANLQPIVATPIALTPAPIPSPTSVEPTSPSTMSSLTIPSQNAPTLPASMFTKLEPHSSMCWKMLLQMKMSPGL